MGGSYMSRRRTYLAQRHRAQLRTTRVARFARNHTLYLGRSDPPTFRLSGSAISIRGVVLGVSPIQDRTVVPKARLILLP